jgi:hypothetical protein
VLGPFLLAMFASEPPADCAQPISAPDRLSQAMQLADCFPAPPQAVHSPSVTRGNLATEDSPCRAAVAFVLQSDWRR